MGDLIDSVFVSSIKLGKTCMQVYDSETGSCIKSFRGVCVAPKSLCPVGSCDYILCGQKDKPLLQGWAINQDDTLQMRFPVPGRLNVMTVSQSEHKYCAIGIEEKIFIYHLNSGCQLGNINRHYQDVTCLKYTSCGNYLASAAEDGFVYIWSLYDLKEFIHKTNKSQVQPYYVLGQHSDKVTDLSFCGPGMRGILVSSSMDHSAKVFDLVTGHLRHTIIAVSGLSACVGNAIGSQVFFAGEKGRVWGINLVPQFCKQDKQLQGKGYPCHDSVILQLALTTAGNSLITGGAAGEVKIWAIVMTETRKTFGSPSFALQKTLMVGGGTITNILVLRVNSEKFSAVSLNSRVVLCPFNSNVDLLNACVLHHPRIPKEEPIDSRELIKMAADLFSSFSKEAKKHEEVKKREVSLKNKNHAGIDLMVYNKRLKESNEELYKFCLKHVLGED